MQMSDSENTPVMSDAEIDQAYNDFEGSGDQPPVSQEEISAPAKANEPAAPAMIQFTHNGKKIELPMNDPRVQQWLSQGHDYGNNMQKFKAEREQFEAQRKQIEALKETYGPVDEWVKQNPDAWNRFLQQYQAAQQGNGSQIDPSNPLVQHIQKLEQKLGQFEPLLDSHKKQEIEAQDKALDADIESVRKTYPDLDLNAPGDDGRTRMLAVLEHANKNGIKNFKTAFKDLYHDELVQRAVEKGKESELKARQKQTKLGLLTDKSAPAKGVKAAQDYKNKTYQQLLDEGLEELGLSS
jgi:hypothetical protein